MPLATTVIGSWPKPAYLAIPDWFSDKDGSCFTEPELAGLGSMGGGYDHRSRERAVKAAGPELEATVRRAVKEVLQEQADLGLGVVTDGEMERGTYYIHVMSDIEGIDMMRLEEKEMRSGAYRTMVPAVRGLVAARLHLSCPREWTRARELAPPGLGVKFTIPGPMTIVDGVKNLHYKETSQLHLDLARALNREMVALVAHGCTHIQVDEPVLMRYPGPALEFGLACLGQMLANLPAHVVTTLHLCCGYPDKLDTDEYLKADKANYRLLAAKIDALGFTQVSIEDAECRNDLSLLGLFKRTQVVLGAVTIARTRVEPREEIRARVREALEHIPAERLVLAPDCGLGMLPMDIIRAKLENMVAVAAEF